MRQLSIKRRTSCAVTGTLTAIICAWGLGASIAAAAPPQPGWTLYSPTGSTDTYLVDLDGNIVHTWPSEYKPGLSVYLVDNGAIMRTCNDPNAVFQGPGGGGRVQRIAWDGTLEWDYDLSNETILQHHDIELMPNGNVLLFVWQRYTREEAIANGRNPAAVGDWVWAETILELEPVGQNDANVVWSWRVWDNLVQNFDPNLPNYGEPADHPGRIDINYNASANADWLHCNGIEYNPALDQIVLSSRSFSELWILSHAPGSGELLYRWGNPFAYGRGFPGARTLYFQHDPQWIPDGWPGGGNITVFNNRTGLDYSTVGEFAPPLNQDGTYHLEPDQPYGPSGFDWACETIDGAQYYTPFMSGIQRLINGNSLLCLSTGKVVEIDDSCNSVWSHNVGASVFLASRITAHDSRLAGLLFCPGDVDGDELADQRDLGALLSAFGTCEGQGDFTYDARADLNDDNCVNENDLGILLANWSNSCQ